MTGIGDPPVSDHQDPAAFKLPEPKNSVPVLPPESPVSGLDEKDASRPGQIDLPGIEPDWFSLSLLMDQGFLDSKYAEDSRAAQMAGVAPMSLARRFFDALGVEGAFWPAFEVAFMAVAAHFLHNRNAGRIDKAEESNEGYRALLYDGEPFWLNASVIIIAAAGGGKNHPLNFLWKMLDGVLTVKRHTRGTVQGLLGSVSRTDEGKIIQTPGLIDAVRDPLRGDGVIFLPEMSILLGFENAPYGGGGLAALAELMSSGRTETHLAGGTYETDSHPLFICDLQPSQAHFSRLIKLGLTRRCLFVQVPLGSQSEEANRIRRDHGKTMPDATALDVLRAMMLAIREAAFTRIDPSAPKDFLAGLAEEGGANSTNIVPIVALSVGHELLNREVSELSGELIVGCDSALEALILRQLGAVRGIHLDESSALEPNIVAFLEDPGVLGRGQAMRYADLVAKSMAALRYGASRVYEVIGGLRGSLLIEVDERKGDAWNSAHGFPGAPGRGGRGSSMIALSRFADQIGRVDKPGGDR